MQCLSKYIIRQRQIQKRRTYSIQRFTFPSPSFFFSLFLLPPFSFHFSSSPLFLFTLASASAFSVLPSFSFSLFTCTEIVNVQFQKRKNPIVKKNAFKSKIDYDQKSSSGTNSEKKSQFVKKLGISKSFICVFSQSNQHENQTSNPSILLPVWWRKRRWG